MTPAGAYSVSRTAWMRRWALTPRPLAICTRWCRWVRWMLLLLGPLQLSPLCPLAAVVSMVAALSSLRSAAPAPAFGFGRIWYPLCMNVMIQPPVYTPSRRQMNGI